MNKRLVKKLSRKGIELMSKSNNGLPVASKSVRKGLLKFIWKETHKKGKRSKYYWEFWWEFDRLTENPVEGKNQR